jgi:ATP-dependent Clp protease ATP-binding subunit ClpC
MYRQWAGKRRMRVTEITAGDGKAAPLLLVTGFGAFRTLIAESGLHVLEDEAVRPDGARRIVARVTAVAGSDRDLTAPDGAALARELLANASPASSIVRRYREQPAPLVRDIVNGWRSGRLSAVLDGDFELIGVIKGKQAAA